MIDFAPGFYPDLPNDEYHSGPGYSSTQLKKFLSETPAAILYKQLNKKRKSKPAYDLGSAVHCLVLEPEKLNDEFATSDVWNLHTKAGRAARDKFTEDNAGKIILNAEQMATAFQMAKAIKNNPLAGFLLEETLNEHSFFWRETYSEIEQGVDILLKARPDAICTNHTLILDVKTCESATYSNFQHDVLKYHYHLSAAMYLRAVNQNKQFLEKVGIDQYTGFVFICVEKEPPFQVACYELSQPFIDLGTSLFKRAFYDLSNAIINDWPTYPTTLRVLDAPPWAARLTEI